MLSECLSQSQKVKSARFLVYEVKNAVAKSMAGAGGWRSPREGVLQDENLATGTLNYTLENGYNVNSMSCAFLIVFKMPGLPEDTGSET